MKTINSYFKFSLLLIFAIILFPAQNAIGGPVPVVEQIVKNKKIQKSKKENRLKTALQKKVKRFKAKVERLAKREKKDFKRGVILLIIGAIFLLIGLILYLSISAPGVGCLSAIILFITAIAVGVGGIVTMIIGLVHMITS